MCAIGISALAALENPALAAWLSGVGIATRTVDPQHAPARDEIRILSASEIRQATVRDILIEMATGAPSLRLAAKGLHEARTADMSVR